MAGPHTFKGLRAEGGIVLCEVFPGEGSDKGLEHLVKSLDIFTRMCVGGTVVKKFSAVDGMV